MADKKAIRGLADAQRAAIFDPTNWKAHWRTGLSLMMLAPRLERTEQAITAFEVRVVVGKEHGIGRERFKECVLSCSAVARARVIVWLCGCVIVCIGVRACINVLVSLYSNSPPPSF